MIYVLGIHIVGKAEVREGWVAKGQTVRISSFVYLAFFLSPFPFDHSEKEPSPSCCSETDWRWLLRRCSDNPTSFAVTGSGKVGLHIQ